MRVLVVDGHTVFRRGVTACLAEVADVAEVAEASTTEEAWGHPALRGADVVVIDTQLPGAVEVIRRIRALTGAQVVACSARAAESDVLAAVSAGAIGYLDKETMTPQGLVDAIRAASAGAGAMSPELLGALLRSVSRAATQTLEPRGLTLGRLNSREQAVLSLVAEGHPIREVAARLSYSERTIKNVIHDVVTKLNVRTRSQAVATAVREGLI